MSSMASGSSLSAAARRVDADRPAAELVDDDAEQPAIDLVEALLVDLEHLHGGAGDLDRDDAVGPHLRVVAHAMQQAVGDARRAARSPGDLGGRLGIDRRAEDARRAAHDLVDVGDGVEIEPVHDAEARAQRRREQPGARRGAHQREALAPAPSPSARRAPGRSRCRARSLPSPG